MFVSAVMKSLSARLGMRDFAFGSDASSARSRRAFLQGVSNGSRGLVCDKRIAASKPTGHSKIRPVSCIWFVGKVHLFCSRLG
jgi:hypothetical protein